MCTIDVSVFYVLLKFPLAQRPQLLEVLEPLISSNFSDVREVDLARLAHGHDLLHVRLHASLRGDHEVVVANRLFPFVIDCFDRGFGSCAAEYAIDSGRPLTWHRPCASVFSEEGFFAHCLDL